MRKITVILALIMTFRMVGCGNSSTGDYDNFESASTESESVIPSESTVEEVSEPFAFANQLLVCGLLHQVAKANKVAGIFEKIHSIQIYTARYFISPPNSQRLETINLTADTKDC